MKSALCAAGVALVTSFGSASAQSPITISEGIAARNGKPAVKNVPFEDSALYLVSVECTPYRLDSKNRNNYYYPTNIFVNTTRQLAFTITLSNAPIGTNEVPPTTSVLAALPVVADTLSKVAPVTTKNDTCSQSFLLTGRTPLYLTALYTDQINTAPSELVNAVEAFASLIAPLAAFFTAGPAKLLTQDTTIANSMTQPYAKLVGTLSYQSSQTSTKELQQGYYLVKTPAGSVAISVDKLASLQSAIEIHSVARALDTSWHNLGQTVQTSIANNPIVCFQIGKTLESNQNLIHSDTVHALARIVNYSEINSAQATNCLGTYFGPEVANDPYLSKVNAGLHLGPGFPDIQNAVSFSQMQLTFSQIANAMSGYAAGKNTNFVLDNWFESQVSVIDTAPQIFSSPTSLSIEQILDKMKGAVPQYVSYGCPEKDNASDASGVQDTGYLLAIGKNGKPEDLLILRTWWRYQGNGNQPHIYQMYVGYDAAIQQALTDYKNVCGYHITVNVPPAPGSQTPQGSQTAQTTPAAQATNPVPVHH